MSEHRESSRPPSDPQPPSLRGGSTGSPTRAFQDRPGRLQLGAALLLGVMLVGSGLYLWRRPRATADTASGEAAPSSSSSAPLDSAGVAIVGAALDAGPPSPVKLSDMRIVACQDRGPKRTPADQCDHLASVEQAFSKAIEQSATCVPPAAAGSTIEYIADVSFSHHRVRVGMPRSGRSLDDRKALNACGALVRSAMHGLTLDTVSHDHARYKIAVTATYTGKS